MAEKPCNEASSSNVSPPNAEEIDTVSITSAQKERAERNRRIALNLRANRVLVDKTLTPLTADTGGGYSGQMVDTGGGFFLEEDSREEEEEGRPTKIKKIVHDEGTCN